jgi:D-cysteine desulfhydrase
MVHNIDDAEEDENTPNARMIRAAGVREYPCHKGPAIADAVEQAMADFVREGRKPYYINGDRTGHGNVHVPMRAYDAAYDEIVRYEESNGVHFSKIYVAASTCTTQSGLIAGSIRHGDSREIIGISVTRNKQRASEVILENLREYFEKTGTPVPSEEALKAAVRVRDQYLCGGYALYDGEIERVIRESYLGAGIPLDPVYTGKAFRGMMADLEGAACENENILFLHTGGAPLFFEYLEKNGI